MTRQWWRAARRSRGIISALVVVTSVSTVGVADTDKMLVPSVKGVDAYVAVPSAARHAAPTRVYRVVFEARHGADKPDELVPAVNMAGSEINTFAAHALPRGNLKLAIVFHTAPSDDGLLDNEHYRAKFGVDNPNLDATFSVPRLGEAQRSRR